MLGEDQNVMSDPKYKQFITAIDKCLKSFEYSSEWADLISCLGKLHKVIQTYSRFSVVPRKLLIGKRLAQCLHPALPSGVHLKALDCYSLILKQIGPSRLAQDLFIYSVGLFPLLSQASIAVRPILLNLYEDHFLPLKKKIYPGLSGFLVALLPGIEEGSEFTDRTMNMLSKLCDDISEEIFFSCLWDTVLHSSSTRLSALLFVIWYTTKRPGNIKGILIGEDVNLMVNALCSSLDDSNVLVQRTTLDFVISFITFHSSTLNAKHIVKLLTYALGVLLRRDMSLNRRIYQWFLNVNSEGQVINKIEISDEQGDEESHNVSYFDLYVHEPLTIAMIILFQNILESIEGVFESENLSNKHRQAHLKPFRILITLLDKPEVGSVILDDIMLEIFRTLYKHSQVRCQLVDINIRIGKDVNTMHNELIKNANLLFSSLEPYFIWEYLSKVLKRCTVRKDKGKDDSKDSSMANGFCSLIDIKTPTYLETFNIISYLLDIVSLETSAETQSEHWPNLLKMVIQELINYSSDLDLSTISEGVALMAKIFSRLSPIFQQDVFQPSSPITRSADESPSHFFKVNGVGLCIELSKDLFAQFVKVVVLRDDKKHLMFLQGESGMDFNDLLMNEESQYTDSGSSEVIEKSTEMVAETFQIFCQYLVKICCFPYERLTKADSDTSIPDWLLSLLVCCCYKHFDIQSSALSTLFDLINVTLTVNHKKNTTSKITPLVTQPNMKWMKSSNLFKSIATNLWNKLSPTSCQCHKRAVELFLQLHNITPTSGVCEDVMSKALVILDTREKELSHWRFSALWHMSREFYKEDSNRANSGTRTIDRCMFLMVDSLRSNNLRVREISKEWLQHSVNFGDIGRILETILLVLLEPTTTRIAIHYLPMLKNKQETRHRQALTTPTQSVDIPEKESSVVPEYGGKVPRSRTQSDTSGGFADDEEDDGLEDEVIQKQASDKTKNANHSRKTTPTHPLLIHKLLYTQRYDHQQCLYALNHITLILKDEGRSFICSAATTSMSVCNTPHQSLLRELLIRHRRALSGNEFYGSLEDAHQLLVRASTAKYLEILLSVCLYFIRSDYNQNVKKDITDIEGNFTVQQASAKVLTQIAYLLLDIARDSGKGFAVYVNDLLSRSKIQRIALHCLLSTIYAVTGDYRESSEMGYYSMVECPNLLEANVHEEINRNPVDLQVSLLKFIDSLIHLESCIGTENPANVNLGEKKSKNRDKNNIAKTPPFEYVSYKPIVSQPMFISAVLSVLREKRWMHLHGYWIKLLVSCLPNFSHDMSKVIVPVVYQLCANLKTLTKIYKESYTQRLEECTIQVPPDYMLVLLNGLTSFCHYCLISTTTGGTLSSTAGRISSKHKNSIDESSSLFSNLVHVFSSASSTPSRSISTSDEGSPALNETRNGLIGILPAIITAVSTVWKAWDQNQIPLQSLTSKTPLAIGQPKVVRISILQLITPIAMNHTVVFLASLADVWCLYRDPSFTKPHTNINCKEWLHLTNKKYIPTVTEDQSVLLEIVRAIKALTLETIVDTSKQVLRQLIGMKERNQPIPLEVCMLQFLFEFLSKTSSEVDKIKNTLINLLKDALSLNMSPPALFVLVAILNIYVQNVAVSDERRARRDVQDLVQKFLDSLNSIAASSLEGSAWFRRSLQVVTQQDQSSDLEESTVSDKSSAPEHQSPPSNGIACKTSQYSVPAILILAEYIAPMMDMVFISEEKDKIASSLVYLIYNIIPYLKNHSNQNIAGFRACSALLAAISDYQYSLRAWRKDVYELFLDSDFFQMDILSFRFWRTIIDRLITYDSSVFKDLMQKIVLSQSGAINIFANREQEMEQRAQLLKRLSFVIFCGEHDQYHQYLPDIQERLAESIRQLQGPFLHEQVFLCFRLLLVRMSSNHLVSLWPPILTELVLVFVHMEHELLNNGKPKGKSKVAGLESFLGINSYFKDPSKWLRLYLAVCKLLDFLMILPSDMLSHYQVYRWAFCETPGVYCVPNLEGLTDEESSALTMPESEANRNEVLNEHKARIRRENGKGKHEEVSKMAALNAPISEQKRNATKEKNRARKIENSKQRHIQSIFFPYISRIVKILQQKNLSDDNWHAPLRVPGELILMQKKIQSIYDLLPFFIAVTGEMVKLDVDVSKLSRFKMQMVEELIEKDFVENSSSLT